MHTYFLLLEHEWMKQFCKFGFGFFQGTYLLFGEHRWLFLQISTDGDSYIPFTASKIWFIISSISRLVAKLGVLRIWEE